MSFRFYTLLMVIGVYVSIFACSKSKEQTKLEAPLFDNIGDNHFEITTSSDLSQLFFDQGLVLAYGLNHAEALRSFEEAARLDPKCAMCFWGIAYVLGPNINSKMDKKLLQQANTAVHKAVSLIDGISNREKGMIWALTKRYPEQPVDDFGTYNTRYAKALGQIYEEYPRDGDLGCLYTEALMNEHPWNFWEKDGTPRAWTPQILNLLETILKNNPRHPGANHYYIHAIEASPNPERGLRSADILRDLVPGAGHLVHMPSHIYIRTGDYHKGTLANEIAARADSIYIQNCNAQGVYPLIYYPHNFHFLAATATLEGRASTAIEAAFKVAKNVDKKLMRKREWGTLQHYFTIPYFVLVKFGQWNKIFELPKPDDGLKYPQAIWHYARGIALLSEGEIGQSQKQLDIIKGIERDSSIYEIGIWELNNVGSIVNIASLILEGEILASKGEYTLSEQKLIAAIEIEESLIYNEPPDWFFSIRHTLGAILIEAQQYKKAQMVYEDDLKLYPKNGWALKGLSKSLIKQGKNHEAQVIIQKFDKSMKYADMNISSSRLLTGSIKQFKNLKTIVSEDRQVLDRAVANCKTINR